MPKINVYVPAWLAEAVKESAISVSAVCQQALEEAVRGVAPAGHVQAHPRELERALTNRARTVLRAVKGATTSPKASAGLHVLHQLEVEGGNLALVVLDSLGVDRGQLRAAADARGPSDPGHDLRWLLNRAAEAAAAMGDQHIGCEHLLLALVEDPAEPAARFLADAGSNPELIKQATRTAAAAAAHARSKPGPPAAIEAVSAALEDIRARLRHLERP